MVLRTFVVAHPAHRLGDDLDSVPKHGDGVGYPEKVLEAVALSG
jgi:hypothetical protein